MAAHFAVEMMMRECLHWYPKGKVCSEMSQVGVMVVRICVHIMYMYILYLKETPVWHIWTRSTLLCDAVTVSFLCPQSKVVPYGVQGVRSTGQPCEL